jgi:hypothetical protein
MHPARKKKSSSQGNHATPTAIERSPGRYPALIPIIITLICLAPFAGKAFGIDEPLFIWAAQHIQTHPADPYGFAVNWYGWNQPMWQVMQNPPLASYFIAAVTSLVGWSEIALRMAFLLPATGAVLGTYLLARRFCSRPVEAVLAAVLTPVFLTCSTSVMCDVMMLAFWVWAVFLWMEGLQGDRRWMLVVSGVLIAASALTKYYGMVLIPLLLVYSFALKRRPGWWLLCFLIPIGALAAYQAWTHALYGRGLLLDACAYASQWSRTGGSASAGKLLVGLAYCGGCTATAMFCAPLLWTRKTLAIGIIVAAISIPLIGTMKAIGSCPLDSPFGIRWLLIAQVSLFALGGVCSLALAIRDFLTNRNADSLMLLLWVAGTFAFASLINWTVNARSMLPMAPAVGILIMRHLDRRTMGLGCSHHLYGRVALTLGALLALGVAHADYDFANASRAAAGEIAEKYSSTGGTLWFEGHWGFQYYMTSLGGRPVNYRQPDLAAGDVIVVAANNTNSFPLPTDVVWSVDQFPTGGFLATMDPMTGAGFHSDVWGPVPMAFGETYPDRYQIAGVEPSDVFRLSEEIRRHAPALDSDRAPK